ncbi:hypothetical protein MS5N3_10030 [Marinobacter salsuginis]|uniref:Uncharacterized protein n=1 Tax=Marinobacter salsuginis TaxID=418719 RepID=A0A5M3PKW1_9GAMM|nr:hypothetical protein MS5N3_10030 [Marinobacter salsuginis]
MIFSLNKTSVRLMLRSKIIVEAGSMPGYPGWILRNIHLGAWASAITPIRRK